MPTVSQANYAFEDETVVSISAMGQSMEVSQVGSATYGLTFTPSPLGVGISLSVLELDATIRQPMGGPLTVDESAVAGTLEFSLDRLGNASISGQPTVNAEASQMVSGLSLAHTFFPGLPGRAVAPGDVWVDTVAYEGEEGAGNASENAVLQYRIVGDTTVAGRALLRIDFVGTSRTSTEMDMSGMLVRQESELEVEGHVLWDLQAGLMFESERTGVGSGRASVPIVPTPLPIRITTTKRVRLQER